MTERSAEPQQADHTAGSVPGGQPPAADEAPQPGARRPAGLGLVGWLRWAWRKLTSMRTALLLLLMLAIAAIPGSVFPQRGTEPAAVNAWLANNPTLGPVADRLGMFDVFASPWFAAIYLLLMVSLTGCVVPRLFAAVRALTAPPAPPPRRAGRNRRELAVAPSDLPDTLAEAARVLRAKRWRVRREDDFAVAEKGAWGELANLTFHVSLLLILVGVALGSLFGWRGTVVVREGAGFANTRAAYDSLSAGRFVGQALPPFRFDLLDFDATFEREGSQRGAPRSFAALLRYQRDPSAPAIEQAVQVNQPLRVDGAKVFLIGHGYAPHIRITDEAGEVVFDDTVVFVPNDGNFTSVGVVKAPDAEPPLALEGLFLPTAAVDPHTGPHSTFPAPDDPALFLSAWTGDLGLDSGVPRSVFSLDTTGLKQLGVDALRVGESMELPGGARVEFVGFDRWASFSIAHDPGKGFALAAGMAALLGLSLSLGLRRRRIWVRARRDATTLPMQADTAGEAEAPGQLVALEVAGWERRDSDRLSNELDLLVADLVVAGATPLPPGVKHAAHDPDAGDWPADDTHEQE